MIGIGALIGVAIIVVDQYLKARKAPFHAPVLAVAVGIYLPLELSVPIFVGGLISWLVERRLGGIRASEEDMNAQRNRQRHPCSPPVSASRCSCAPLWRELLVTRSA